MAQQIIINVDDPDDILVGYGAGALIRVERDATSTFGAPTEITTIPIVSGQTQYEYWDAAGADTAWYRSRYSAAGGSPYSGYSDAFQPGSPRLYASLDSLREYLVLPNNDRDNLLLDLLRQATDYLTGKMGRDCFRHPAISGDELRLYAGSGDGYLDVPEGIIALTGIRVAGGTGGSFTDLVATDWRTDPRTTDTYVGVGGGLYPMPSRAVELTDVAGISEWYTGEDTVELTGSFGFPAIPSMVEKATLDLAREWYRQGPGGGGPVGVNQFGTPLFLAGMPKTVADAISLYGVGTFVVV